MKLPRQLSYAAGSNSREPYGYRVMDDSGREKLLALVGYFPVLKEFLSPEGMIVSAYPAALGLTGVGTFVDTYLHSTTFMRALRLAARESRTVLVAAQPLVCADFLWQHYNSHFETPGRMVLALGGYYLPTSLEQFLRTLMAERGCSVKILHSYGVAEVGHTCFASMSRFECGSPRYTHVATDVTTSIHASSKELSLASTNRLVQTGDHAEVIEGTWRIKSSESRLHPQIVAELESWTADDWKRRTGYLKTNGHRFYFQLRQDAENRRRADELSFFDFWKEFGGSFTCKPDWSLSLTEC